MAGGGGRLPKWQIKRFVFGMKLYSKILLAISSMAGKIPIREVRRK